MQVDMTGSKKLSRSWAQVAAAECEKVRARHGRLTPVLLAKAVRKNPRHPLRKFFTSDRDKAAWKCWVQEAAELIRSVKIVIQRDPNDVPRTVRGLVSVVSAQGRDYVPFVKAMSVEEHRNQMLADAMRELQAFQMKYKNLAQLAPVFAAIEKLTKKRTKKAA